MLCKVMAITNEEAISKLQNGERFYTGPRVTGANFKTNTPLDTQIKQLIDYINAVRKDEIPGGEFFVAPANSLLYYAMALLNQEHIPQIKLAAQGFDIVYGKENTSAVTIDQLKQLQISYVIVGHSEERDNLRKNFEQAGFSQKYIRQYENNLMAGKVKLLLENDLVPVLCIGEKKEVRFSDAGNPDYENIDAVKEEIIFQLEGALNKITPENLETFINKNRTFVIAYEPVWSIGTGITAKPGQAEQVNRYIREILINKYGTGLASKIAIQYGGSVKVDNVKELAVQPNIDGSLVGGASYGDTDGKPTIFVIANSNEEVRSQK